MFKAAEGFKDGQPGVARRAQIVECLPVAERQAVEHRATNDMTEFDVCSFSHARGFFEDEDEDEEEEDEGRTLPGSCAVQVGLPGCARRRSVDRSRQNL